MIKRLANTAGLSSAALEDWGKVAEPLGEPVAQLRGVSPTEKGKEPDFGIWECSPGKWNRQIRKAEFAHFISGRATFRASSGQVIEINAGDALYFPADSLGVWEIHETVRKTYILLP
uniref:Cupin domain-containing protein n=1 Tax=Dongia rigui TaxID=940149 RepID=A0ABU5E668_9PROT|nr:cupin domain-containing protein [Dongia rigui]MDY0874458.1 cupin domain-containing protein [Dongia rigui]